MQEQNRGDFSNLASLCLHRRAVLQFRLPSNFSFFSVHNSAFSLTISFGLQVTEPKSLRVRLCITLLGILVVVFGFCISFWEWWWTAFTMVEEGKRDRAGSFLCVLLRLKEDSVCGVLCRFLALELGRS